MYLLWQNLLSNALKFCQDGVPPVIEIGMVEDAPMPDGFCRLIIADNGIGFEEKYLDRIFTVFRRLHTRQDFEGTGIGLAICRRIVERHNGRIWATSIPNQGSTFYIELPRTQPEA
jgi:signal transduction histidine kinase